MAAKVNCSICGKLTDPSLENCPHCGSPVDVGGASAPSAAVSPSAIDSGGEQCPSCGTAVQDGDIVCVRCGVNLLTGHQVAQKHEAPVVPSVNRTPYLVGALVLVVLMLVGALAFILLRDPMKDARQKARTGDVLGAINILQKHTDNFEDDVDAFAMLGRLYWQAQQYADASTAFETASRLRSSDEDLAFMAVLAAGKIPGAAGAGRQLSALRRMAESHPSNERAQKMLALALGTAGELGNSDQSLTAWATLGGSAAEVDKYRGIVRAMDGDFDGARAALGAADGTDRDTRVAQAYLASLEGSSEQATSILAEALGSSAGNEAEAASRLGLLYMAQGAFDKALPLLRPAQGALPSPSTRFFYALALQAAGLADEALMEFDRLVTGGAGFAAESAVQMGILYIERDQLERAEESMRKSRKFGTSSRLYTVEGQIAALRGDLGLAQESFRKAIQEDGTYPAAHLEHGLAYVRRGALPEGVRELERYLELADARIAGGRVNEVELLVKQLQQTLNRGQR